MEEGFQIKPCSVKAHKLAGALLLSISHGSVKVTYPAEPVPKCFRPGSFNDDEILAGTPAM
jgi:hypothetical protein